MPNTQLVLTALTLVASLVSPVLVWRSNSRATVQREGAAKREEWFRRLTWAVEMTSSENQFQREAGLEMIDLLVNSELAGPNELASVYRILASAKQRVLTDRAILERTRSDEQKGETER